MTRGPQRFLSLDAEVTAQYLPDELWAPLMAAWQPPAGEALLPRRRIHVLHRRVAAPDGEARSVSVSDACVQVRVQGDQVWIGDALHLELHGVDAVLSVAEGENPTRPAEWLLAFAEVQRAGGWLSLHAAVVAAQQRAVAITGPSGAGKSTAALRLAADHWTVIAEDHAWVRPHDGLILGLDRSLRATEQSLRTFAPELLEMSSGQDAHGKYQLPLISPQSARLRGLLVLGLPTTPQRAQQVQALWESAGVPLTVSGRRCSALSVAALIKRLQIGGVSRQNVVETVKSVLASVEGPYGG